MSARLERNGVRNDHHRAGIRAPALRSIITEKRWQTRTPKIKTNSRIIPVVTINVDVGEESKKSDDGNNVYNENRMRGSSFMGGAAALNALMLIVVTIILSEKHPATGCTLKLRTGTQLDKAKINVLYICLMVNVVVGLYPLWISYFTSYGINRKEDQIAESYKIKDVRIFCLITWLLSLNTNTIAWEYQMLLSSVLSTISWNPGEHINTNKILLIMCILIGSLALIQESSTGIKRVVLGMWWLLGILVFAPKFSVYLGTLSIAVQMSILWLYSVKCWIY
jgi:hypothetical protein